MLSQPMPSATTDSVAFRPSMRNPVELHHPAVPPRGDAAGDAGVDASAGTAAARLAARRRASLLALALAVPALLVLGGAPSAWPLLILPLVVAGPLCGPRGLVAAAAAAGVVIALASGAEGAATGDMAVGLAAFVGAGLLVAAGHRAQAVRLERMADTSTTDRLTGLRNYAYLEDVLARECRRAERYGDELSLVLLDLDRFKEFNDRHGHEAGNRLLASVGRTVAVGIRGSDVGARFGGEEFAVLVPHGAAEAAEAGERLRLEIGRTAILVAGGQATGVTASAGVAPFVPGDGPADLLRRADGALYASKRAGRDRLTLEDGTAGRAVA